MIAVPAIDLRGGRCVQLVGGRPDDERVSLPDPPAVARRWWEAGFGSLHVVDLDAALGSGSNQRVVEALCAATPATVQVGGGIRSDEAADALLAAGADRVIVGTRAVDDRDWLEKLAGARPARVIVAADVRDRLVLRRGWTESSDLEPGAFVRSLDELPLAGVLCTDVGREGRAEGIDDDVAARVVEASSHPVWFGGGIATIDDLWRLEGIGAAGAVLGMALYTGALDAGRAAARFGRGGSGPGSVGNGAAEAPGDDAGPRWEAR